MGDNRLEVIVVILDMNLSDFDFLLLDLTEKGQLILFLNHFTALGFHIGPVSVTFFSILLNQTAQHKHTCDIIFLNHSIKVIKCSSQWGLGSNDFFALKFDNVSIDIVLNLIFLLGSGEYGFGRIECHYVGISVEGELLRILVQFLQMVLSLGHESQDLELRRQ